MTPKEALDKIKALFSEQAPAPAPEETPAQLEAKEYVLEGGAKILISELEPGGMAQLVDDAGNVEPAPVGEHKLADGTMIVVGENGLLTGVTMPESATPEPEEDMKAQFAALKEENERLGSLIAEMAKQEEFTKAMEDVNAKLQGLADAFASLVQTPAADPIQAPKNAFDSHRVNKNDRMAQVAEMISKLKS
jgi:hypothetical protein